MAEDINTKKFEIFKISGGMDHTVPKVRAALFAFQLLSLQRDFYHLWSLTNIHKPFRDDCLLSVHLLRFCVCLGVFCCFCFVFFLRTDVLHMKDYFLHFQ